MRPWARLHLDFLGPFEGKNILIIVDAHSKWMEASCTPSTSSSSAIEVLRTLFAQFGVPETVVTHNGTGFVGREFEQFLTANGIRHITSAPYHPASNGLAERSVQIVKKGLKKLTTGTMSSRLAKTLFNYCIAPQSTTGISPAELLLGRRPRTCLDLLRPNTAGRVEEKQRQQKAQHDRRAKERSFGVGDAVFVKNFGSGRRWFPGQIVEVSGPVSFHVLLEDGRRKRCHQDHLRFREVDHGLAESQTEVSFPVSSPSSSEDTVPPRTPEPRPPESDSPGNSGSPSPARVHSPAISDWNAQDRPSTSDSISRRYPRRSRRQREWFEPGNH